MGGEYKDFLAELTKVIAGRSGLTGTNPRQLAAYAIDEGNTPLQVPASRLTTYGGKPIATAPVGHATVQCLTVHRLPAEATRQAMAIRAALYDSDQLPARELAIVGYQVKSFANITTPGLIGRDPHGRAEIVFNFEVHYIPA